MIDIYVHALWPVEKECFTQPLRVKKYQEAMYQQISESNSKVIVVSSQSDFDLPLIEMVGLAGRETSQLITVNLRHELFSNFHCGYVEPKYQKTLEELSESESIRVNGFIYGYCPTMFFEQLLYMRQFEEYYPKCFHELKSCIDYYKDFFLSDLERDRMQAIRESEVPSGWHFGISAARTLREATPRAERKALTLAFTNNTKIFLLNHQSPGKRIRYFLNTRLDKALNKLTPSIVM